MHAIQAFLMKGLLISILASALIIPGSILGQEVTIYGKDRRLKERIRDRTIYEKDWRVKGHIEDGRV